MYFVYCLIVFGLDLSVGMFGDLIGFFLGVGMYFCNNLCFLIFCVIMYLGSFIVCVGQLSLVFFKSCFSFSLSFFSFFNFILNCFGVFFVKFFEMGNNCFGDELCEE